MKRRHFFKYGTFAACGYGLAACGKNSRFPLRKKTVITENPINSLSPSQLEELEKSTLALGYAPSADVAPWLVAIEQGFFAQYGLEVSLYKQANQQEVEQGLLESRFDAAITSFSLPLINQLKKPKIDMVALMQVHRHGGAITLGQKTWDNNVRSGIDYANFAEFAPAYLKYVRSLADKTFGIDNPYSVQAYLYRYWWAEIGLHPELELELLELPPTQLSYKLQSGEIHGYMSNEPWAQAAIAQEAGFIGYLSEDVWRGHPGSVIAATAGWLETNPNTAKALIAATLMGCQYCQNAGNAEAIAALLQDPLGVEPQIIAGIFSGQYPYGGFDISRRPVPRKNYVWHGSGRRLVPPDHANYCWQSQGLWLLSQMVRWHHFNLSEYPENATEIVAAAYPQEPYREVAKAMTIELPDQVNKTEAAHQFIDNREFVPENTVAYLNQFKIRI